MAQDRTSQRMPVGAQAAYSTVLFFRSWSPATCSPKLVPSLLLSLGAGLSQRGFHRDDHLRRISALCYWQGAAGGCYSTLRLGYL